MKRTPEVSAALSKAIEPFVRDLALRLAEMLAEHADRALVAAREHAIERLSAELAGGHDAADQDDTPAEEPEPKRRAIAAKRVRVAKPETYAPSRRAREDRTALQANGKAPPSCSKCGYVGGNARGCGTAHETLVAGAKQNGVTVADVEPPPPARSDRFAAIEAAARARRAGVVER